MSALIVLASEPFYVFTQLTLHTDIKVYVESETLLIRSLLTCVLVILFPSLKLTVFCISEVIYSLLYPVLSLSLLPTHT